MDPAQPGLLQLDHVDGGRDDEYAGLSHKACNLSAGGQLGRARSRGYAPAPRPPAAPRQAPAGIQEYVVPPGVHSRIWCYVCRGPDCPQAGPDSPLGRRPW